MDTHVKEKVTTIVKDYTSSEPEATAKALREYWLEFEPNQGINLVKAEQRERYEAVGIPIPILKDMGNEITKAASQDVSGFLPLAQLLWKEYGREGRVVAHILFGSMVLIEPQRLVPLLKELCRQCVSWEDADRLAMDAVEPIVRKVPAPWLSEMAVWLHDENKWVRRSAITIIGRLPMKHPAFIRPCLELTGQLLFDPEEEVRRAVSFAIRTCARIDPQLVCAFMKEKVAAANSVAVWVLCDVIKSLDRRILGEFTPLLPYYQKWGTAPDVSSKDRRSIESAIKVLEAL